MSITNHLTRWAAETPENTFLALRREDTWLICTYREAHARVTVLSHDLIRRGAEPGQTLLLASPNSIDAAVLGLAAMRIGVAIVPVSPSWTLDDVGREKLRYVANLVKPRFAWFAGCSNPGVVPECVSLNLDVVAHPSAGSPHRSAEQAVARVGANTIAKVMLTSGSTGLQKGVINTHGMLAAQQEQMAQLWTFLDSHPPVLCDWLPWNHTSGGNNSFNMVLRNGGTLYIDDGRPTSDRIARTLRNIAEVRPTWYTNVPLGYSMLLPRLEEDIDLAAAFFDRLDLLVYGGAALSAEIWSRIDALFRRIKGRSAPWASGWGLTETTSTVTVTPRPVQRAGLIGIPLPGMDMRLEPHREGFLAHVRGPNVMPGYWGGGDAKGDALDAEGYFCTGDLVRLADPSNPDAGLEYLGRATEEFKLGTGNWVLPGKVRLDILRLTGPDVADVVIAGPGQDFLTVFVWMHVSDQYSSGSPSDPSQRLLAALEKYHALNPGATHKIGRICILSNLPQARHGELTEKGSINQARFLSNRRMLIQAVYERARGAISRPCDCEFEQPVREPS